MNRILPASLPFPRAASRIDPAVPLRIVTGLAAGALALLAMDARAHDAKYGWSYPFSCCSDYDCREVPGAQISERPDGYVIERTGEVVAYSDTRVRFSPDGEYHWCSVAGANDTRTICLFVPPKAY